MYLAQAARDLLDLAGQLAGGGDDQGADGCGRLAPCRPVSGHRRRRPAVDQLQGGQDESGRLAGAGLGAAEDVAAGEGAGMACSWMGVGSV